MRGIAFVLLALVVAASCGGKIGDGSDAGVDGGGDVANGQCCPISPQPACCMSYGGYAEGAPCATACDGMPSPNEPGWHQATDSHGCPIWVQPTNPQSICGQPPPPPIDGGGACSPQNIGAWSPQIDPPFFAHANVCSAQLVSDISTACFGSNVNQSTCQSLMTQNPSCAQCLITPPSAAKWGAMLSLANGVVELDIAGCIADLGDVACAQKESDAMQCESAACDYCTVIDTQTFQDYQQCIQDADATVCAKYEAAKCSPDAGTYAQCFATNDFQSAFKLYATLFCGP